MPSGDLPCGDISPLVGITGTPVIDSKRGEIFVDADTLIRGPSASGGVEASHRLFGLDLFTGKVELDERAMPNAGEDQLAQLQRPGLALDRGLVIIAYGQNAGDCPGPNGPAHGYVVSIPETGGRLHYFQIGSGRDRGAVWMGGSSPVVDPTGNIYVASADGYDLGAGQPYDDSDAVLELSPTMHLESIFYPKDWQKLSADDLDLGTGDPALVHGFVLQVGKTDTAYLLRQGHLGGEEGEVASLSVCSGDPDGGHAVKGSVVYVPCPNGVTAIKVSTKAPYLKRLWTDNDGAAGGPIIADGLLWTIGGDNAVHGLDPANGKEVVSIPFGGVCEPLPDAVGRRRPAAASGHRSGLRLHGSGRAAAATSREVRRVTPVSQTVERPSQSASLIRVRRGRRGWRRGWLGRNPPGSARGAGPGARGDAARGSRTSVRPMRSAISPGIGRPSCAARPRRADPRAASRAPARVPAGGRGSTSSAARRALDDLLAGHRAALA